MIKKIFCFLLAAVMLCCFAACGKEEAPNKERKRAQKGQSTITGKEETDEQVVLDAGYMKPLNETYAKSNKANMVYDPNIFIELAKGSGKVKVACVGDSITYGTGATKQATASYPAQLQKLLDSGFSGKFEVTNYGHAGAFIADFERTNASTLRYCFTDEYAKLRKAKPDVVIMMLGINDIGYISNDAACEELVEAYCDLIGDIKGMKSNPLVFVCTPLVRTTAYSSYLNCEALRNAVVEAANRQGVYVIDTYNITKEYYSSALYESDGLHPNNAGYQYLANTINSAIVDGLTEYAETSKPLTPKYVVYVDSDKGTYGSVGATADNPTSSMARAVELCQGGGTIVVSGQVTPATTGDGAARVFIAPENYGKITVTSIDPYTGEDYRSTKAANITVRGSMYLNGDFEFENLNFNHDASALKIACNYNNIKFGQGIKHTVISGDNAVIILGHDMVTGWQTEEAVSCKENCALTIESGTYTYLRAGNYRAYSDAQSKYAYGTVKAGVTVDIIINGGTFKRSDAAHFSTNNGTLTSAIGQNGMEAGSTVNMTVNGGTFEGSIFAVPRMNPYPASGVPTIAGNINITVNGGIIRGSGVTFMQTYEGSTNPSVTGRYNLTINGGSFTGTSRSISGKGCAESTVTLGQSVKTALQSLVSDFKTVN